MAHNCVNISNIEHTFLDQIPAFVENGIPTNKRQCFINALALWQSRLLNSIKCESGHLLRKRHWLLTELLHYQTSFSRYFGIRPRCWNDFHKRHVKRWVYLVVWVLWIEKNLHIREIFATTYWMSNYNLTPVLQVLRIERWHDAACWACKNYIISNQVINLSIHFLFQIKVLWHTFLHVHSPFQTFLHCFGTCSFGDCQVTVKCILLVNISTFNEFLLFFRWQGSTKHSSWW